jgi:hypothetical protein
MMLGFLDDLHSFAAGDVDRVAADLANEMNGADIAPIEKEDAPMNGHSGPANGSLSARLSGIEQRLAQQETFMRRAGVFIHDFFSMRGPNAS